MLPGLASTVGFVSGAIGALIVTAFPSSAAKTQGSFGPGALTLTSINTTAAVAGGSAPFAYAWAYVSGDVTIAADSPTAATTAFSASVALGVSKAAVFKVTVTDANGSTGDDLVNVNLRHVDLN